MSVGSPQRADFSGNDRFEITERLGAGGMGVVYRAYDRDRGEHVALKTLAKVSAAAIYRFKQEFRALANVTHPNVVQLHELISQGDQWFFTMELVAGASFLEYVRADAPTDDAGDEVITALCTVPSADGLDGAGAHDTIAEPLSFPSVPRPGASRPPELALRPHGDSRPRGISSPLHVGRLRDAIRQLALGVMALHEAGKLHRDIKPSNVLVTNEGRVVLLDFGLVLDLEARTPRDLLDAPLVGTAAYMSPEQGAKMSLTPASDWYTIGVMLYQALTGRLPFYGDGLDILAKKRRAEPTPPRVLVPRLPADLNSLCVDLLRMQPEDRPTGAEVIRRLEACDTDHDDSGPVSHPTRPASSAHWSVPAGDSMHGQHSFLGREQLFARLTNAFTDMGPGHPITVFVSGKSGFGKSALVARFLDALAHGNRALVLRGRCFEKESVPYKALDSLIDDLSQHLGRMSRSDQERLLPMGIGALAKVFPVLRRVESIATMMRREPEVRDRHELRTRAFTALRGLFTRLAKRRPLVLHIDDLQWGDVDSATVLRDLLRPPAPPPMLLVAVYQSEHADTSPVLETLLEEATVVGHSPTDVRKLSVGPLTPYEARDLALALLGRDDKAARRHAEAIAIESGGSPLFVQELVRFALAVSGGDLAATTPSSVGMTLEQALAMRLVQLPLDALSLLEVVAVAGRPTDVEVAVKAAGIQEPRSALAQLRAGHLVRTFSIGEREEIETYHERITSAVLDQLDPRKRTQHHRELATALEDSGTADAETLALHFAGAGNRGRAGEYAAKAAREASDALAFERAVHLYHLAIDSCDPADPRHRSLSVDLAEALAAAGRGAEAAHVFLAAASGERTEAALELERHAAEQLLRSGHRDEGMQVLASVLERADMKLPKTRRQVLSSLLGKRLKIRLRGYSFTERDESELTRSELMRIDVAWTAVIGLGLVDPLRAAEFQSRHLLLALRAGEINRVTRALAAEATYAAAGGLKTAGRTKRLVGEIHRLAKKSGEPYALAMAAMIDGVTRYLQGSFQEASEQLDHGEMILRERCTGVAWDIANAQMFSLATLAYLGDLKSLAQRVPALVMEAEERGDLYTATVLRTGTRNMAWLVMGDVEEARRQIGEARRRWTKHGFLLPHYFMLLGEANIDLVLGNGKAALARLDERWADFEKSMLTRVEFLRAEANCVRARALLSVAFQRGEPDRGLDGIERAIRAMERSEVRWVEPQAHLLRAGIAVGRRETEAAVDHLTSAAVGFDALQMRLHANAARRRLGEILGGDEGRLRIEAADSWMRGQGVREPHRITGLLAPFR